MAIKDTVVSRIRLLSLRAFKKLAKGRGVSTCIYYPAISGTTHVVKRNLYHDVISDTGPGNVTGLNTYVYIEMNLPVKTVQSLGWWKADENLPIVGFMPFDVDWEPQDSALLVVPAGEGFLSGTYRIKKSTSFGQGTACMWAVNLVPKRV